MALYNEALEKQKEIKFPYAIFSAVSVGNKLYAVEKNGYLIEIENDLSSHRVLGLPDEIESPLFMQGQKIYVDDRAIELK